VRDFTKDLFSKRLQILAVELGLAGGEVLKQNFGFTDEQVARWLDAVLDRAKKNRKTTLSEVVDGIDND